MSDKCSFCGADIRFTENWADGTGRWFDCGTYQSPTNIVSRNGKCYETQIAQLKAAVDEAKKAFNDILIWDSLSSTVKVCLDWLDNYGDKKD